MHPAVSLRVLIGIPVRVLAVRIKVENPANGEERVIFLNHRILHGPDVRVEGRAAGKRQSGERRDHRGPEGEEFAFHEKK